MDSSILWGPQSKSFGKCFFFHLEVIDRIFCSELEKYRTSDLGSKILEFWINFAMIQTKNYILRIIPQRTQFMCKSWKNVLSFDKLGKVCENWKVLRINFPNWSNSDILWTMIRVAFVKILLSRSTFHYFEQKTTKFECGKIFREIKRNSLKISKRKDASAETDLLL